MHTLVQPQGQETLDQPGVHVDLVDMRTSSSHKVVAYLILRLVVHYLDMQLVPCWIGLRHLHKTRLIWYWLTIPPERHLFKTVQYHQVGLAMEGLRAVLGFDGCRHPKLPYHTQHTR